MKETEDADEYYDHSLTDGSLIDDFHIHRGCECGQSVAGGFLKDAKILSIESCKYIGLLVCAVHCFQQKQLTFIQEAVGWICEPQSSGIKGHSILQSTCWII